MSRVTIEGSTWPSTHLATGERRTVERTSLIDKMIANGFVIVIEEHPDTPSPTPIRVEVSETPESEPAPEEKPVRRTGTRRKAVVDG